MTVLLLSHEGAGAASETIRGVWRTIVLTSVHGLEAFKEKRQRKTRYWDVDSDGEEAIAVRVHFAW